MRGLFTVGLAAGLLAGNPGPGLHAESRGKPYTEDQLLALSTSVFVGEVLETREFPEHRRVVPTRVRVLLSIKGEVPPGGRVVDPKHPGAHVYYDQEFSQAAKGRLGVFYVGVKGEPNLLMGYREVRAGAANATPFAAPKAPATEPENPGEGRAPALRVEYFGGRAGPAFNFTLRPDGGWVYTDRLDRTNSAEGRMGPDGLRALLRPLIEKKLLTAASNQSLAKDGEVIAADVPYVLVEARWAGSQNRAYLSPDDELAKAAVKTVTALAAGPRIPPR